MRPILLLLTLGLTAHLASAAPDFSQALEDIAHDAQGRVGAAVRVIETGASASLHGQEKFAMQSVYKLPIAMALMREVDRRRLRLDQEIVLQKSDLIPESGHSPLREQHPTGGVRLYLRQIVRYAIVDSDGTASDLLLRLVGGPKAVMRYLTSIGIHDMVVATSEKQMLMGERQMRNSATPVAAVQLLALLQTGHTLAPVSRAFILGLLFETATGITRIRGMLPRGTRVAHKTGTSQTEAGVTAATNDIGIVVLPSGRHLAVAVFVGDSTADETAREGVIARIAQAAWSWAGGDK